MTSELIVRLYKKIDMCDNLEWVAGSGQTGEGLDGIVRLKIMIYNKNR